jgi:hypothetical protein
MCVEREMSATSLLLSSPLVFIKMANTTQNTVYTSNHGGNCMIYHNSNHFMDVCCNEWGEDYPSNLVIQNMATWDTHRFHSCHHMELTANDTIWATAIVADCGLIHQQGHATIRRDYILERLINIGAYDRSTFTDLDDDLAERNSFQYAAVLTSALSSRVFSSPIFLIFFLYTTFSFLTLTSFIVTRTLVMISLRGLLQTLDSNRSTSYHCCRSLPLPLPSPCLPHTHP